MALAAINLQPLPFTPDEKNVILQTVVNNTAADGGHDFSNTMIGQDGGVVRRIFNSGIPAPVIGNPRNEPQTFKRIFRSMRVNNGAVQIIPNDNAVSVQDLFDIAIIAAAGAAVGTPAAAAALQAVAAGGPMPTIEFIIGPHPDDIPGLNPVIAHTYVATRTPIYNPGTGQSIPSNHAANTTHNFIMQNPGMHNSVHIVDSDTFKFNHYLKQGEPDPNSIIKIATTREGKNDAAKSKAEYNNPIFAVNTTGIQLDYWEETTETLDQRIYTSWDNNNVGATTQFCSKYNFGLTPLIEKRLLSGNKKGITCNLVISPHGDFLLDAAGNPTGNITKPYSDTILDGGTNNSIGVITPFLEELFNKFIRTPNRYNNGLPINVSDIFDVFAYNTKLQQKRLGDWGQALACIIIYLAIAFLRKDRTGATLAGAPQFVNSNQATFLTTGDQIAGAYTLLMGINLIFLNWPTKANNAPAYAYVFTKKNVVDANTDPAAVAAGEVVRILNRIREELKIQHENKRAYSEFLSRVVQNPSPPFNLLIQFLNQYNVFRTGLIYIYTTRIIQEFQTIPVPPVPPVPPNALRDIIRLIFTHAVILSYIYQVLPDCTACLQILSDLNNNMSFNEKSNAYNLACSIFKQHNGTIGPNGGVEKFIAVIQKGDPYRLAASWDPNPHVRMSSRIIASITNSFGLFTGARQNDKLLFLFNVSFLPADLKLYINHVFCNVVITQANITVANGFATPNEIANYFILKELIKAQIVGPQNNPVAIPAVFAALAAALGIPPAALGGVPPAALAAALGGVLAAPAAPPAGAIVAAAPDDVAAAANTQAALNAFTVFRDIVAAAVAAGGANVGQVVQNAVAAGADGVLINAAANVVYGPPIAGPGPGIVPPLIAAAQANQVAAENDINALQVIHDENPADINAINALAPLAPGVPNPDAADFITAIGLPYQDENAEPVPNPLHQTNVLGELQESVNIIITHQAIATDAVATGAMVGNVFPNVTIYGNNVVSENDDLLQQLNEPLHPPVVGGGHKMIGGWEPPTGRYSKLVDDVDSLSITGLLLIYAHIVYNVPAVAVPPALAPLQTPIVPLVAALPPPPPPLPPLPPPQVHAPPMPDNDTALTANIANGQLGQLENAVAHALVAAHGVGVGPLNELAGAINNTRQIINHPSTAGEIRNEVEGLLQRISNTNGGPNLLFNAGIQPPEQPYNRENIGRNEAEAAAAIQAEPTRSSVRIVAKNAMVAKNKKGGGPSDFPPDLSYNQKFGFHPLLPLYVTIFKMFSILLNEFNSDYDDSQSIEYPAFISLYMCLSKMTDVLITDYIDNKEGGTKTIANAFLIGTGFVSMFFKSYSRPDATKEMDDVLHFRNHFDAEYFWILIAGYLNNDGVLLETPEDVELYHRIFQSPVISEFFGKINVASIFPYPANDIPRELRTFEGFKRDIANKLERIYLKVGESNNLTQEQLIHLQQPVPLEDEPVEEEGPVEEEPVEGPRNDIGIGIQGITPEERRMQAERANAMAAQNPSQQPQQRKFGRTDVPFSSYRNPESIDQRDMISSTMGNNRNMNRGGKKTRKYKNKNKNKKQRKTRKTRTPNKKTSKSRTYKKRIHKVKRNTK